MAYIFKNKTYFLILFLVILLLDIFVKLNFQVYPYRYFSKPLVVISLLSFYLINNKEVIKKKYLSIIFGLSAFLLGDILLINGDDKYFFISGIIFFMIGKIFFCIKFSNHNDFATSKLFPFLAVSFIYMFTLFKFIYDGLKSFFLPVLFYFFITLVMAQMLFLRKNAVVFRSYIIGLIGVIILLAGETIQALKSFYTDVPYQDVFNMLLYGFSLYLIISAIIYEDESPVTSKVL